VADLVDVLGRITREHTMWCGRCWAWHQEAEPAKAKFVRMMRSSGWRRRKGYGWVCALCVAELRQGETEVGYRPPSAV
jgi:hypothetical protein